MYHLSDLEQLGVSNNSKEIEDIMFTKTPFVFYDLPHNLDLLVNWCKMFSFENGLLLVGVAYSLFMVRCIVLLYNVDSHVEHGNQDSLHTW